MIEQNLSIPFDSVLLLSFGGPEAPGDVLPFLENVLRGRNVPRERMMEVAEHYHHFDGISPLNAQNRALIPLLRDELTTRGHKLPVYWGNRNWKPFLSDTLRQMHADGCRRCLVYITSAYSSYSGCRQYREDLSRAEEQLGGTCPSWEKLPVFFNQPKWIEVNALSVKDALHRLASDANPIAIPLVFTAHSIPESMSATCEYKSQLEETCQRVAEAIGHENWQLVFQSRSGPPQQPWLAPDICDVIEVLAQQEEKECVIAPIGFTSDHLEVLFDLDYEAQEQANECGIRMERARTAGNHPLMISMIADLIEQRLSGASVTPQCLKSCCPPPKMNPLQ